MDVSSLSTLMAQDNLFTQAGAAVARKGLDQQKLDGQNLMKLIDSASGAFADPSLGTKIDTFA